MVRTKNRYLVLLVKAKDGRAHESLGQALPAAIRSSLALKHGDAVMENAAAALAAPYYHHPAGVAIVRCARSDAVKVVESCLAISVVDFKGVTVKLLKLTGALRVARREAGDHIKALMPPQSTLPQQHQSAAKALLDKLATIY